MPSRTIVSVDAGNHRQPDHPVIPLLVRRWSPRAMAGTPIDRAQLDHLFEAARWAPSSYNIQPWRFIYALRDTSPFQAMLDALVPANQSWAHRAGALIAVVSLTINPKNGKPAPTHAFDTGAAWMALALEGTVLELAVHAMAGFDAEAMAEVIALPANHRIEAMVAVGNPGVIEDLDEKQQEAETPSSRKPIGDVIAEARFPVRTEDS